MFVDSPTQNPASLEFLSTALMRQHQQQQPSSVPQSKYAQLLAVIEEMGKSFALSKGFCGQIEKILKCQHYKSLFTLEDKNTCFVFFHGPWTNFMIFIILFREGYSADLCWK